MTKIEWTHRPGTTGVTWNPVSGCSKISAGCTHCYAERMAKRLAGRHGYPAAPNQFDVTLHPDKLDAPLHWKKPRTVFVCSMGDLFHQDVEDVWRIQVWRVMEKCPRHTFIILTKRPDVMLDWFQRVRIGFDGWPPVLPNVWLGVTIESPEYGYRVDDLRQTPAALRFLSLEPLLASFRDYPGMIDDMDWIIVGGETGPGARKCVPIFVRQVRDQCIEADVPFFFKRWGARVPMFQGDSAHRLLDGQEWRQWPQ